MCRENMCKRKHHCYGISSFFQCLESVEYACVMEHLSCLENKTNNVHCQQLHAHSFPIHYPQPITYDRYSMLI